MVFPADSSSAQGAVRQWGSGSSLQEVLVELSQCESPGQSVKFGEQANPLGCLTGQIKLEWSVK